MINPLWLIPYLLMLFVLGLVIYIAVYLAVKRALQETKYWK